MPLSVWQIDPVHLTPYYNLALCSALVQAGCDVHYATSEFIYDSALCYPTDVQIHRLYFPQSVESRLLGHSLIRRLLRTIRYPLGHRQLLQIFEKHPPSIVHIQWVRLPRFDRWLIDQLHRRGIPVVYTAHDVEPLFSKHIGLSEIYGAVDAIIVHTEANEDLLQHHYSNLAEKISVIPHLAPQWTIPVNANRATARIQLGISADVPVILFFGSNRPYKGLDLLVEAFKRAKSIRSDLHLLVAGRLDAPCILSALQEAGALVTPEYILSHKLWLYHLAADIAVFPYRQISQSGALITAMSFGLPVIVTDVGGMPETVNGNGWIVASNDTQALAEAIVDAFSDVPRLYALGDQSIHLIRTTYSPSHVAELTMQLYREII